MTNDSFPNTGHVPVLVGEVLHYLAPAAGQVCLDCTAGLGGHAAVIVPRLAPGGPVGTGGTGGAEGAGGTRGRYVGLDADPGNVAFCRERLAGQDVTIDVVHGNFAVARRVLDEVGVGTVDLLLADLGFSSNQMADASRGLSFSADGPLDMRFDPTSGRTAADLINTLGEQELANLIFEFGEERRSRKIAAKIVEQRQRSPIKSTVSLAQLVRQVCRRPKVASRPPGRRGIDPATRTFMALRIAVNCELESLRRLLDQMPQLLGPGAAATIISFHSLEDRLVKQAFAQWRRQGLAELLTRKVVVAGADEQRDNPRSRSAKLRAIRWLGPNWQGADRHRT